MQQLLSLKKQFFHKSCCMTEITLGLTDWMDVYSKNLQRERPSHSSCTQRQEVLCTAALFVVCGGCSKFGGSSRVKSVPLPRSCQRTPGMLLLLLLKSHPVLSSCWSYDPRIPQHHLHLQPLSREQLNSCWKLLVLVCGPTCLCARRCIGDEGVVFVAVQQVVWAQAHEEVQSVMNPSR